jgi:hypothetical protein
MTPSLNVEEQLTIENGRYFTGDSIPLHLVRADWNPI